MPEQNPIHRRGRPRRFCVEEALNAAMELFWRQGYTGTAISDLTDALAIKRPSLYAAFGSKEQLFLRAFGFYKERRLAFVSEALMASSARQVAEKLFRGTVAMQIDTAGVPRGCMGINSVMALGEDCDRIREEAVKLAKEVRQAILVRFEAAKACDDIPPHVDPASLTNYLLALLQGLSVQGSMAASRDDLDQLVETCLALWPTKDEQGQ